MTFVQTANEDNLWPGAFEEDFTRSLFCADVDDKTTSVYVFMDQQAVILPKWLSDNYKRLSDTVIVQKRAEWDDETPLFYVYHRRIEGEIMPCFGRNGGEAR